MEDSGHKYNDHGHKQQNQEQRHQLTVTGVTHSSFGMTAVLYTRAVFIDLSNQKNISFIYKTEIAELP